MGLAVLLSAKDFLPPSHPAAWPCAVLISTVYCLSSSREKISAYLLEVLQGLINCKAHWKIWIKCTLTDWSITMTTSIISRCCRSKDKRAGLEISSKPPTWRVIARPKSYILIFKYQWFYIKAIAERDFVWTRKAPELAQEGNSSESLSL